MRKATLKTYTKNKLESYYQKPLRFTNLFNDSKDDERLAELAQAYFLAWRQQAKADFFSKFTNENYKVDDFLDSKQKYVVEFRSSNENEVKAKEELRHFVLNVKDREKYSWYKLAQLLETNQSNVMAFFVKNQNDKLSLKKLFMLRNKLVYSKNGK